MVWGESNNNKPEDNKPNSKNSWNNDKVPNIEEVLRKSSESFKNKFNNNNPIKFFSGFITFILFVFLLTWFATGFYIVEEDEQAVVTRFGKFARIANPGPNYHLPFPIESSSTYKVTVHQIEEFGYRSSQMEGYQRFSQRKTDTRNIPEESLMLTGDENIADINFLVKWQIDNIEDFVFKVDNPKETVRMAAESAVREVIGNTPFTEAQTLGRSKVEERSMLLLQQILDLYGTGIKVIGLQMLKFDPPQQAIDAFKDVQTSRADKERVINQAYAYRNDLLPRNRGEAKKIEQEALAYKQEVISAAEGEAARFRAVYDEYKNAKEVIKKRMLLETLEEVLVDVNKLVVDKNMKNIVPFLPLKELEFKK